MDSSSRLSGAKTKEEFLSKAHEARLARELARKQDQAATTIQAYMKSFYCRHKMREKILNEFKDVISEPHTKLEASRLLSTLKKVIYLLKDHQARSETLEKFLEALIDQRQQRAENCPDNITKDQSSLLGLIVEDCSKEEQSKTDWLKVLVYLVNLSLENIASLTTDKSSSSLTSLASHLRAVNYLAFGPTCKPLQAPPITSSPLPPSSTKNLVISNNHLASSYAKLLGQAISIRTHSKETEVFLQLSETVCKIIRGPKTELNTSIINDYIRLAIHLMQFQSSTDLQADTNSPTAMNLSNVRKISLSNKPGCLNEAKILTSFLSVPSLVNHFELQKSKLTVLNGELNKLFLSTMSVLNDNEQVVQSLTSTPALSVLANLIHMAALNEQELAREVVAFSNLVIKLLEVCHRNTKQSSRGTIESKPTTISGTGESNCIKLPKESSACTDESYNHILGWLTRETAPAIGQETSRILKTQLGHLWSAKILKILFHDLVMANERFANKLATGNKSSTATTTSSSSSSAQSATNRRLSNQEQHSHHNNGSPSSLVALRRAFERAACTVTKSVLSPSSYSKTSSTGGHLTGSQGLHGGVVASSRLMSEEAKRIAMVCYMLSKALRTLRMIRQDILAGLCLHDYILKNLWIFITSLGPQNGMKAFLDHLALQTKSNGPEFHILMLFCECSSHIISILDDSELYEQQKPFAIEDLISVSQFLNTFVFRLISNQLCVNLNEQLDKAYSMDPILQTTHKLLTDLYKRDCRRKFAPDDHWLLNKELKLNTFLKDLEQGKPIAALTLKLMPHIIPHKMRLLIFRRLVASDKSQHYSEYSTFITIHRSRLVEDGYQQLAKLAPKALKGVIRVKFINDHGLDEAGLDQDGVFKEFLEDTIKRVFDPALNLFSSTSEQRLYPSPTSRLHEDHLSLFNFVGKMLAKAVYEGIVVDVPFANFFLSRVLGQPQSALYSPIDELPSLDPELYKSLTYIKHYEGDVAELDLTFSIDQDFMGKIETYELEPGGKFVPVTKETRVRYIHSVANFRMKTQIEEQTEAFVRGFKSIINLDWLKMFSASEFQRLISGDTAPIDLVDLRKNTKYFGGFHNSHRVICWLWDILERDFSPEEHRLFLKFVTSCSKPPLLGFANLEPPFSIRCVEVSDDQDSGDTVGSVLRGFFAIRRSDPVDRLPTSATCFNMLKLPNYQRRSTLREKLRYAIRSSTGFELS